MTESLCVGYFLEDIAHVNFITALAGRVSEEVGLPIIHDVRNGSGGHGRALTELAQYLRDAATGREPLRVLLVVAIDSNCVGYNRMAHDIIHTRDVCRYPGTVVCAVPDPHIERWYLADRNALRSAVPGSQAPAVPARKCQRDVYKQALRLAFESAGIKPQLGGAEYAVDIVSAMDLGVARRNDRALDHFLRDFHSALLRLRD